MSSSWIRSEAQDRGRRPPLLRTALDRWRAWRITDLLPGLMEEFHPDRPSLEVLDCADAVVDHHKERGGCTPPLGLAHAGSIGPSVIAVS